MTPKRSLGLRASRQIEAAAADWVVRRDTGLSDADQQELSRWRTEDPRHAEAFARHDRSWSLLDRPRSGGRTLELLRALPARVGRRRRRRGAAIASAVALVLVTCTAVWNVRREPLETMPAGTAHVVMPRKQVLPDGSAVELKGESKIQVAYTAESRRVTLVGGEALFQVAKDPVRPFIVTAAGVDVRAVGTVFLVQLGGTRVEVIVTEGTVAVEKVPTSAPGGAPVAMAPEPPRFVEAGARLTVDTVAGPAVALPVTISATEIAARLGWRSPFLEFTDMPLTEAVAMLNRHSPIPLVVDDPTLAALPVNGRFRADNSETLARLLESSFGLKAVHRGNQIVLQKAAVPPVQN